MSVPTPEQFAEAVSFIRARKEQLFEAVEAEIIKLGELTRVRAWHVRQGLEGSNQTQRDAYLEASVEDERTALDEAEEQLRGARFEYELAVLELDSLRYQLRAVEVALQLERAA